MTSVFSFLEQWGSDSDSRGASPADVSTMALTAGVDAGMCAALGAADRDLLASLVGAPTKVFCSIAPARDDEDKDEESPQRDDDEDEGSSRSPSVRRVA